MGACVVLYPGAFQIASLVGIIGLQSQLILRKSLAQSALQQNREYQMQLQFSSKCCLLSPILIHHRIFILIKAREITPLWLNVVKMGNHPKALVFSSILLRWNKMSRTLRETMGVLGGKQQLHVSVSR